MPTLICTPGKTCRICLLVWACMLLCRQVQAQHLVRVDAAQVLHDVSARPIGINMNYLTDGRHFAPVRTGGMQAALQSMQLRFLRYPGGEKSDNYLWSVAPWAGAFPVVARTGAAEWPSGDRRFTLPDRRTLQATVLDFDEFMQLSKSIGAEPILVVAYDGMYKKAATAKDVIPTREQLLKNAEEWVRYANITKKYHVKYWMIGNESYKNCDYNGCATAEQYRDDLIAFASRMKKIDPGIKIIANGEQATWWATVLPQAAPHIDYLGLSNYPAWNYTGGYKHYQAHQPDFLGVVRTATRAIEQYAPVQDRQRIKIMVTEFNAIDWSGSWANTNDLGHALFCFEMLGQHLNNPDIISANFWTTRWVKNTLATSVNDALDSYGNLTATGKSLAIWGNYLLQQMVHTTSTATVRTFACLDPDTAKLNVFLLNKDSRPQQATISLLSYTPVFRGKRWEYSGKGPEDPFPVWAQKESFESNQPSLSLQLPATSVTVLELSAIR
jgi:alpha-L-arabinofuranosidase